MAWNKVSEAAMECELMAKFGSKMIYSCMGNQLFMKPNMDNFWSCSLALGNEEVGDISKLEKKILCSENTK